MHPRRAPMAFLLSTAVLLLLHAGCATKDSATSPKSGPTANFSATPLAGPSPLDVDFTNQSASGTSTITLVLWDFGDGTTSEATSAHHLYGVAGTYSVSLTVTTADGTDTRTRVDYIVVGDGTGAAPPNAVFSGTPTGGSAPLTVDFTDASTTGSAPITAWSWTFGDGATSTTQNPSHTYTANGTYTVALAVTTSVGTDTETKPGYIVVSTAPVPPRADFSGTPTEGSVPLTVQFTDRSEPGSAAITSRTWNFGDGGSSTATNPSHLYGLPGTYTVTLTVTTSVESDSETKTGYVTVRPPPVAPTAQFSGTPRTGAAPLDVQFTDLSIPGTAPIATWSWTFGDGGTSSERNPAHTYAAAGSYTVALTVTTVDGQNTNTQAAYITPCATPAASFTANVTTGLAPLTVGFHDNSTGGPTTFSWSFGDGGTSTTKDPSHIYSAPGIYTVSHTAGNACGNDTITKTGFITVQDPCPNPIYAVTGASWSNITLGTDPGYRTRARLTWTTSVSTGCTRSVFARIYVRPTGTTGTWTLYGTSSCYTVSSGKTTNVSMFVQSLAKNCYDLRVAVYECNTTIEKAARGPGDDADLTNECFEP